MFEILQSFKRRTLNKKKTIPIVIWIADRNPKRSDCDQKFLIAIQTFWISIRNGLRSGIGSRIGSKQSPTLHPGLRACRSLWDFTVLLKGRLRTLNALDGKVFERITTGRQRSLHKIVILTELTFSLDFYISFVLTIIWWNQ